MPTTTDTIRKAISRADGISEEVMTPLTAEYAIEVERVNDRLAEAVKLLRKGLRSEAIQRANMTPNVFDAALALDFPELQEWLGILQFLGIPLPDQVNQDYVQQINEAIVESQPLEALLINHRKLAIAKAPLSWRLKVLRRIAAADITNVVWEEDLENWEAVRAKQLAPELQAAISSRSIETVRQLHDELTRESWRIDLDRKLVSEASSALQRFEHETKIERLQYLGPKIHDAFSAFDEHTARGLRSQWNSVTAEAELPIPSSVTDEVAPAFAWLSGLDTDAEQNQARLGKIAILESALDQNRDLASLEKAYAQATQFDEPIPVQLEQRYRSIIGDMELRSKRKTQLVALAIVATVLLAAGGLGFQQWRAYGDRQITDAYNKLNQLLKDSDLNAASEYLKQIKETKPEVANSPRITGLASQLLSMEQTESGRAQQFLVYIERADAENAADIDVTALNKAEELAVTEAEKGEVFRIRRSKTTWENQQKSLQTDAALAALKENELKINKIEQAIASEENVRELLKIMDELDAVKSKFPARDSRIDAQATLLRNQAKSIRDGMNKYMIELKKRQNSIRRLLESKTLPSLASNLEVLAADVSSVSLAQEYREAAGEIEAWAKLMSTNTFNQTLASSIVEGISADEATVLLSQLEEVKKQVPSAPLFEKLPELKTRLVEITERDGHLATFFENISLDLFADLVTYEFQDESKQRYFGYYQDYLDNKEKYAKTGFIGVQIVADNNGAVQNKSGEGPLNVILEPRDTFRWLANKYEDEKKQFNSDWDSSFLKLLAELIKRKGLDGTVKEYILLKILKGSAVGSANISAALAKEIKFLERREEERSEWFKPQPLSDKLATNVEQTILPQLSDLYQKRNKYWNRADSLCQRNFAWMGVLLRNETGDITPRVMSPATKPGSVYVVVPGAEPSGALTLTQVGNWANDSLEILDITAEQKAGRPFFFLPDTVSSK